MNNRHLLWRVLGLVLALVILAACGGEAEPTATSTPLSPTATRIPPTSTPVPPTATPIPPTDTPVPPNPNAPPVTPIFMYDSRFYSGISYLPDWTLDVYLPEAADGPYPTLLLLHGASVNNTSLYPMAKYFSQRGYATVLPNWMSGQLLLTIRCSRMLSAPWLGCIPMLRHTDSIRNASSCLVIRLAVSSASVIGATDDTTEFMEGCLYQLPASDWMKGVMTYGGLFGTKEGTLSDKMFYDLLADPFQLTPDENAELYQTLMDTAVEDWRDIGGLSAGEAELLHILAPYWVDGNEPPFLLIHGERDFYVGVAGPEAFASQLQAAGSDAEMLLIDHADHGAIFNDFSSGFKDSCQAMEAFFAEVLE